MIDCVGRLLPLVVALVCGNACARAAPEVPRSGPIAIERVTVIDVRTGRRLVDHTVVVDGGRIAAVGSHATVAVPDGATLVDGDGRFLIPGLWDMHVHTVAEADALLPVFLAYGVTGVRDMGAPLEAVLDARTRIAGGTMLGPRMVVAGPILDGPLGAPMPADHRRWRIEVTDTAVARRLADSLADAGADFLKVHERLAGPVYQAIARQAGRRGLAFAGHAPTAIGPAAASAAGQRSIEHLVNVPVECTERELAELRPRSGLEMLFGQCSRESLQPLVRQFARDSTWHTPTLVIQRRLVRGFGAERGDPGLRYVPHSVRATLSAVMPLETAPFEGDVRDRMERLLAKRMEQVLAMHRAGVGLLVGTDAPGVAPGWAVHEEMRLFVEAGLTPTEALRAATLAPAEFLGALDSLGAIRPGAVADLVLLGADPMLDITNTTRIVAVVAGGRLLDGSALRAILDHAGRRRR